MAYNVFVVEDHPVMRETIRMIVERELDFVVCGTAADAEEALDGLPSEAPSLFIIDMSLPGMNGAELVRRLSAVWPGVPCMILSGHGERGYVQMALDAGAQGYVLKGEPDEIPQALRAVVDGGRFISPRLDI